MILKDSVEYDLEKPNASDSELTPDNGKKVYEFMIITIPSKDRIDRRPNDWYGAKGSCVLDEPMSRSQ